MAKKKYTRVWMDLNPEDPEIVIGGSQGTSGEDSPYSFSGFEGHEEELDLIMLNCDDIDLADMDTDGNLTITYAEFVAWFGANEPW